MSPIDHTELPEKTGKPAKTTEKLVTVSKKDLADARARERARERSSTDD